MALTNREQGRQKQNLYAAIYRANNREKLREKELKRYHTPSVKKKILKKHKKQYRLLNKLERKKQSIRYKFKISDDRFDEIFNAQGGKCALCGELFDENIHTKKSVIDHDHDCCPGKSSCGKCVRAIIHSGCNIGIGFFEDNASKLRLAAQYLDFHNANSGAK